MGASILAERDRVSLDNGMELRLLSALELLQARREAAELAQEEGERALCSNACLLARALEFSEEHTPVFDSGRAVLIGLTAGEIGALAARWGELHRGCNPGLAVTQGELEDVKKKLRDDQAGRLRWRVLKQFRALPTEPRSRAMLDRDYLWCLANALLDGEEREARLCPDCARKAREPRCPACGRPASAWGEFSANAAFDPGRFEQLRGGRT